MPVSLAMQSAGASATSHSVTALVAGLIARCPAGTPFDAREAMDQHPELANHKSALLELAYEEYSRYDDLGMPVEPGEFAARFPDISRSLLHQIEVHQLLADGLDTVDRKEFADWPLPGQAWLNFHLLEELGRGAYSRVYLACEKSLGDRMVVVKAATLGPREAHTLGRLQHPQIVPVHSVQRDDQLGLTALCMPFLSRASLFDVIDTLFSEPPPPSRATALLDAVRRLNSVTDVAPEAASETPWPRGWRHADAVLYIGVQLAEALQHAHQQGVLHGDVKPSNVLITEGGRAVLLDFNLAIFVDDSAPFIAGTLPYMAPEQLRPLVLGGTPLQRSIDERSDVFSLGLTLFELLYGQSPFGVMPVENSRQLVAGRLLDRQQKGPVLPEWAAANIDRRIREIITRCLEFDPARRPQSMGELVKLLCAQLRLMQRVRRGVLRHRRLTIAAATLVCAAVLSLSGWQASRPPYPVRKWRAGVAAYERKDFPTAVEQLTLALDADLQLHDARLLRGIAYFHLRNQDHAMIDLRSVIRDVPDGRAAAALAHLYIDMLKDYGMSGMYYRNAVEHGYRSAIIYNNLGYCLEKTGSLEQAADYLQQACTRDPQMGAAFHNRARVEFRRSLYSKRCPDTAWIEEARRLGPETAELDLDLALNYAEHSRYAKDGKERQELLDQMFEFLKRGLGRGLTRDNVQQVAKRYQRLLPPDPRWNSQELDPPATTTVSKAVLLLDPLDELSAFVRSSPSAVARR